MSSKWKHIMKEPEICTGCRACELKCSLVKERVINGYKSRIRVTVESVKDFRPMTCELCDEPPCLVCPDNAIKQDEKTGIILIDGEKCVRRFYPAGCNLCIRGCDKGAMFIHLETNLPIVCDLCEGEPACVKHCLIRALKF